MSFSDLATAICNTEFHIERHRQAFRQKIDPNVLLGIFDMYRCVGCGSYLMDLDKDVFTNNLFYSGKCYLFLLELVKQKRLPSRFGWRAKSHPWLDVIAIGAVDLGRQLAALAAPQCDEEYGESLENFLYFKLIEGLFLETLNEREFADGLGQFEKASDGGDSDRFHVLKALFDKDAKQFSAGISSLIGNWSQQNKKDHANGNLNPYYFISIAKICIEGIALLKLAKKRGLPLEEDFPYVPAELVEYQASRFPDNFSVVG